MHSKMMTVFVECARFDLENHSKCPTIQKQHQAIDTSCAFETNDLNLTTANFDSYGHLTHVNLHFIMRLMQKIMTVVKSMYAFCNT